MRQRECSIENDNTSNRNQERMHLNADIPLRVFPNANLEVRVIVFLSLLPQTSQPVHVGENPFAPVMTLVQIIHLPLCVVEFETSLPVILKFIQGLKAGK